MRRMLTMLAALPLLAGCTSPAAEPLFLSEEQLSAVYEDFTDRLVPCLRLLGFGVDELPERDLFVTQSAGYPRWNPYPELDPVPTADEWPIVGARCPPPELASRLLPD
jgi:hypothetical protein